MYDTNEAQDLKVIAIYNGVQCHFILVYTGTDHIITKNSKTAQQKGRNANV